MYNSTELVYKQAFIVLDSSSGALGSPLLSFGSSTSSTSSTVETPMDTRSLVIASHFSNVPVTWDWQLEQGYRELGEALQELTQIPEDDEWGVESDVYQSACYVAAELVSNKFPAPKVFNHGSKSVVFNWAYGFDNLYLTISSDKISALISSPDRIQRRLEYSPFQLGDQVGALFMLGVASWPKPLKRVTSGTVSEAPAVLVWGPTRQMHIPDGDVVFRHCIYPLSFNKKGFSRSKLVHLVSNEDGSVMSSVAWRAYLPTEDDVHGYGCRLASHMNERDLEIGRYKDGNAKVYCGAYSYVTASIRALVTAEGLEEIETCDVIHRPENGEESHADLVITFRQGHGRDIEGTKTAIWDRLWNCSGGPFRHVCECDMAVVPHPSSGLSDSPSLAACQSVTDTGNWAQPS